MALLRMPTSVYGQLLMPCSMGNCRRPVACCVLLPLALVLCGSMLGRMVT